MNAVFAYSTLQYAPKTETFFKNVYKLNPGHSLTVDLHTEDHKIEKYWQFSFDPARLHDENYEGKKAQIRDVLTDSVAHHMIADVPVASFLSSGVDSSIIASLAHAHIQSNNPGEKLKTYTIGFPENRSETADAAEHAKYLGTDHKEIHITFDDYFSVLKKCAWHFDEPVADPSAVSLYLMAREVAKEVKVVLSGEGADELFGGYGIYQESHNDWIKLITRQPKWLKSYVLKPISFCLNTITDVLPIFKKMPGISYLHRAITPVRFRYLGNASIFTEKEKKKLFKNYKTINMISKLEFADQDISQMSESEYMQYVDIHNWMRGDILAKADKMTMAHSLELRVPFLDVEVSNVARDIHDSWKYIEGTTKYILRDAFKDVMPVKTNKRPKLGFPTPWHMWLQHDAIKVQKTILDSKFIQEICNTEEIEKMFTSSKLKDKFVGRRIFVLLMLALWYNVYIEEESYA
jgi:asparagine synthase (glutamine-hydrolysing)